MKIYQYRVSVQLKLLNEDSLLLPIDVYRCDLTPGLR